MTNKIYLSFNRLYTLKDGDYHGATLTYRIKHGDDLLSEGEIKGKSLSLFIRPIAIEETEITKPLTVEYVCTGNVEDIFASEHPVAENGFYILSGRVFINKSFFRNAPGNISAGKIIADKTPNTAAREKVEGIVGRYLSGECSEYADDMVDELMLIVEPPGGCDDQSEADRLNALVTEIVTETLKKEQRPGGLLFRK